MEKQDVTNLSCKQSVSGRNPESATTSNRMKEFPTENVKNCIAQLIGNDDALSYHPIETTFSWLCGKVEDIDLTDGLRITFQNGEIIHLRSSGNAPEFRCYNEADSIVRVKNLNQACMEIISLWRSVGLAFYPSGAMSARTCANEAVPLVNASPAKTGDIRLGPKIGRKANSTLSHGWERAGEGSRIHLKPVIPDSCFPPPQGRRIKSEIAV